MPEHGIGGIPLLWRRGLRDGGLLDHKSDIGYLKSQIKDLTVLYVPKAFARDNTCGGA
jgi:hypothetical protein